MGIGDDFLGADRLFGHRPVADGVALGFEALLFLLDKEELQAVGPQAILNRVDLAHDGLDLIEVLGGLLKIADADGILADIRLLAAEHGAAQVLDGVFLAWWKMATSTFCGRQWKNPAPCLPAKIRIRGSRRERPAAGPAPSSFP